MANQPNQKLKLLHVLQMLLEKTDDTAGLTTQDIIEELSLRGIDAERKSINRDIQTLKVGGCGHFFGPATLPALLLA